MSEMQAIQTHTCRDCGGHVEWWEAIADLHGQCLRIRRARLADYGPHIRPGVRVMDASSMRTGRVVKMKDCPIPSHIDESWGPRNAFVLFDGGRPGREAFLPSFYYVSPNSLEAVPEQWTTGGRTDHSRTAPAMPWGDVVIRPDSSKGYWALDHKSLSRGWAARGYLYQTLSELLDAWAVDVSGEPKCDEWGVYLLAPPLAREVQRD